MADKPTDVAFEVEMLPAGQGDCILVTAPGPQGDFVILVDTGNGPQTLAALKARLLRIPVDPVSRRRRVDLFIITHIDDDHIRHAVALLNDESLELDFGDIWFNGFYEARADVIDVESMKQADILSKRLRDPSRPLPHNLAFNGGPVQVPSLPGERQTPMKTSSPPSLAQGAVLPVDLGTGAPDVLLLSPLPVDLRGLGEDWDSLVQSGLQTTDESALVAEADERTPVPTSADELKDLADSSFEPDETRENICSIVVLLTSQGRRLLLTGDGHPVVYEPALAHVKESKPGFHLDIVKVAHHGSADNTTAALKQYGATAYLISTNGKLHEHPDSEAVARLIVDAESVPTFFFNFPTARVKAWEALAARLKGFEVVRPSEGAAGMSVQILADGTVRQVTSS